MFAEIFILYAMKKIILFVILFLFTQMQTVFSQISGISASKLVAYNTSAVPKNAIEFEPAFDFSVSKNDSILIDKNMGFRFTYGLNNKTEIGILLPFSFNSVNWGIKYHAFDFNQLSFGIIAGIENALTVNNSNELNSDTFFKSYAGGIVSTYQINDKLSVDFDSQIQNSFHFSKQDFHLFINSEIGCFVTDGLQIITGLQYEKNTDMFSRNQLTLNSGITVEKAKNFILVLNFPYRIKSKYKPASVGFAMALTILIE